MKHTPLYDLHLQSNAKMVDFSGWGLPQSYGSQIKEHTCVREDVGIFDVSHMNVVDILGVDALSFMRYLLANDVKKLTDGKALYSCMLNEQGGILDDLIVYRMNDQSFRLVLNAATRDKDLAWIEQQSKSFEVTIVQQTELAMMAIQGPNAELTLCRLLDSDLSQTITALEPFQCVQDAHMMIARSGYTGEDGFELILPFEDIKAFWEACLAADVSPIGLGARDTLRLEAGMHLYGTDMDESKSPFDVGLSWTVAMDQDHDFIGRKALVEQKEKGLAYQWLGLILPIKGVLRGGMEVRCQTSGETGHITSGSFSPVLGHSIGLIGLPVAAKKDALQVKMRNQWVDVQATQPRFVRNGKALR